MTGLFRLIIGVYIEFTMNSFQSRNNLLVGIRLLDGLPIKQRHAHPEVDARTLI